MIQEEIDLLKALIACPSFSEEEDETADLIQDYFVKNGIATKRSDNNVIAFNKHFDKKKTSILLNSHHDTVHPNKGYTIDPFMPIVQNGKLFGLGSNDAGGALVSLMNCFKHFYLQEDLKYNLILAATAEEENSGEKGIRSILEKLPTLEFAILGEPTEMQIAIAEKGLLVIDGIVKGIPGHVAHENTINPILLATDDIKHLSQYSFKKKSDLLGPVKISCSQILAGKSHNVVPASCEYVLDVRVNEHYSNQEVFEMLQKETKAKLSARSFHLNSSGISTDHPVVKAGLSLGLKTFGSPTLSDQSNLKCPSIKLGPGSSLRSHQADEFIYLNEIEKGTEIYVELLNKLLK